MTSSTFGAPFGGTTRAGQYGVDCAALRSILPPNGAGLGGNCWPEIVLVAPGEPAGGVVGCCAPTFSDVVASAPASSTMRTWYDILDLPANRHGRPRAEPSQRPVKPVRYRCQVLQGSGPWATIPDLVGACRLPV